MSGCSGLGVMNLPPPSASVESPGSSVWNVLPSVLSAGRPVRRAPLFVRLWLGFLLGRVLVAVVLLLLPLMLSQLGASPGRLHYVLGSAYLGVSLVQRLLVGTVQAARVSERQLALCALIDGVVIALLNDFSVRIVNYYALLSLPLLYVAILGSRRLAMASAAAVSLLLLSDTVRLAQGMDAESAARLLQAGVTAGGAWMAVLLVHYLSERLEQETALALSGQEAARAQGRINEVVISGMTDGVLVIDHDRQLLTVNPAAHAMLGLHARDRLPMDLAPDQGWKPLLEMVTRTFETGHSQNGTVELVLGSGLRGFSISTRLAEERTSDGSVPARPVHCVVFVEDLQELQGRVRTEKLAAMGRMSAAVAHEIRNPLAAIAQANDLLREDVHDARSLRLTDIIAQNARRLSRTVDDILEASRMPVTGRQGTVVDLGEQVGQICRDWQHLHPDSRSRMEIFSEAIQVAFDVEHLRRLLVNLLDNAFRYAGEAHPDIRVAVGMEVSSPDPAGSRAWLKVWNAGPAVDKDVSRHLFEPFFSSGSRSSGLGLYICRQLCETHGACIEFGHNPPPIDADGDGAILGNQFTVIFKLVRPMQILEQT